MLLKLQHKIAADLTRIEDCKEALRGISEERNAGFTEEVDGLGSVEVKAGREAECKGESPRLNIQKYLDLDMPVVSTSNLRRSQFSRKSRARRFPAMLVNALWNAELSRSSNSVTRAINLRVQKINSINPHSDCYKTTRRTLRPRV